MKRTKTIILALVFILTISSVSFGDITEKLSGHWADKDINRTFMAYYFPYLTKNNFRDFNPNEGIENQNFTLSTISLFNKHYFDVDGLDNLGVLKRSEMLSILGSRLESIGVKVSQSHPLNFRDVDSLSQDGKRYLRLLNEKGIIIGEGNNIFNPNRNLTQAEAVIVLQRLDKVLKEENIIPFKVLGTVQTYNGQEEMITKIEDELVKITITKEFPTPGYSITVDKIQREGEVFRIYFTITPPDPDLIQPQVITYKTLTIEIQKSELGEGPYNFVVDGFRE